MRSSRPCGLRILAAKAIVKAWRAEVDKYAMVAKASALRLLCTGQHSNTGRFEGS